MCENLTLRLQLEREEEILSKESQKFYAELEKSLLNLNEEKARLAFEHLLHVNKLKGITVNLLNTVDGKETTPFYAVGSLFLYDCYKYLMKDPPEAIHYVTGMNFGSLYTMDRMNCFKMDVRTPVYVKGNIISSRNALLEMEQYGHLLQAWFHSHPGSGEGATNPSSTDKEHQERLERGGYKALGGIFTRDGFLRFFSLNRQFKITIYGKGVEKISETVFRLTHVQ